MNNDNFMAIWNTILTNLYPYLIGVISNLVTILLLFAIGWLIYKFASRKHLLSFFGISRTKKIKVYVSNIKVLKGGSIGIDEVRRAYQGVTVAFEEMKAASEISKLFNVILPSFTEQPGFLKHLLFSDIKYETAFPNNINKIDPEVSLITLGSPAYNAISDYVEKKYKPLATFRWGPGPRSDLNNSGQFIMSPTAFSTQPVVLYSDVHPLTSGSIVSVEGMEWDTSSEKQKQKTKEVEHSPAIIIPGRGPYEEAKYGFVERIVDHEHNCSLFYIAGLCELTTAAAAYYLIKNWRKLQKRFPEHKSLVVLLEFDLENINNYKIVFQDVF